LFVRFLSASRRIHRSIASRQRFAFRKFGILSFSHHLTLFGLIDYGKDILILIRPFVNRKSLARIRQQGFIMQRQPIKNPASASKAIACLHETIISRAWGFG
jgi:hypothetical protein